MGITVITTNKNNIWKTVDSSIRVPNVLRMIFIFTDTLIRYSNIYKNYAMCKDI